MFRRLSEPLPLSEASMLALRPAMNAPVLNVKFLPVGPARAAVVAFAEEYGGIGMALGIRTNEGGHVAVIRNQESIDFDTPIPTALEPLVAEAERMGFLLDEDMVEIMPGHKGRAHARGLWARLMGEVEMPPAPRAVAPQPAASEPILELSDAKVLVDNPSNVEIPELELDDLVDFVEDEIGEGLLELDLAPEAELPPTPEIVPSARDAVAEPSAPIRRESAPEPAAAPTAQQVEPPKERRARKPKPAPTHETPQPAAASTLPPSKPPVVVPTDEPAEAPEQMLSKFRSSDPTAAQAAALPQSGAKAEGEGGNELGRIPLVRIRRERDGSTRVPYLARLLSSF